jgi:hypothetical protein
MPKTLKKIATVSECRATIAVALNALQNRLPYRYLLEKSKSKEG